jgi:hypothetical protein
MNKVWAKYARDPFLRALGEVPWFGPVISAVLVALLINILTEALTAWGGLWLGWGAVAGLALAAIVFVNLYSAREEKRRGEGLGSPIDLPNPGKKRGLIFLFSREDTLREAIEYHRPLLEDCWLLVTPEMQERAGEALGHFEGVAFHLQPLADRYDSGSCYETVRQIYRQEVGRLGMSPAEVIADITGGTKPMTMGAIVACLEGGYPVEHVPTRFDATGKPTGPLPPIEIVMQPAAREAG